MKIKALYVSQLVNAKHFNFMQFVVAAISQFSVVSVLFPKQVAMLREAFDNENDAYLKHNRSFLTPAVNEEETNRDKAFRALRDALKVVMLSTDAEKVSTATFINDIVKDYGGSSIITMPVDAESGVLTNLCEDLQEKYPEQIASIGLTELVETLKTSNEAYIQASANRTLEESQNDKAAMSSARSEMDEAYHGFVDSVNLHVKYDGVGELPPFIKYLNTEIERYRIQLGIGVGGSTDSGEEGEEGVSTKAAIFKFKNGNEQKLWFVPGEPIIAPENTPGYRWDPEIPEVMPKRGKTFREVPIEEEEATATFHFFDHREEEIKQVVGSILQAPQNTEGYRWNPEVPTTMPAEDTNYYEQLIDVAPKYTVTYKHDGSVYTTQQYEAGATISEPEPPYGYYWYNVPQTMPDHDLTINSRLDPNIL